mmetsp:Transcript_18167/g.27566  ORF Transcript_18167/g.27566 Transcript_18167/m.27566 type:complete len:239 (-) Transcript_18167:456-1172(-)
MQSCSVTWTNSILISVSASLSSLSSLSELPSIMVRMRAITRGIKRCKFEFDLSSLSLLLLVLHCCHSLTTFPPALRSNKSRYRLDMPTSMHIPPFSSSSSSLSSLLPVIPVSFHRPIPTKSNNALRTMGYISLVMLLYTVVKNDTIPTRSLSLSLSPVPVPAPVPDSNVVRSKRNAPAAAALSLSMSLSMSLSAVSSLSPTLALTMKERGPFILPLAMALEDVRIFVNCMSNDAAFDN